MNQDPFEEYLRQTEPNKRDKGYAWNTAIGLQAVDGLRPSHYLLEMAIQNIEGNITIEEAQELLDAYYKENPKTEEDDARTEEADKVSIRIAKLLSEEAFSFTPNEYISIHKKLFIGVYGHAGKIRDYNITKKEWVLDGATVLYGSASELRATLEYDFEQEKNFSYKGLSVDEVIRHLAVFVSRLWQIHIFSEGNTRTTAVFFIKYLRALGFQATNDIFAKNAWYFRNALVRANYNDLKKGIHETTVFLELFLRNLLLNEQNELHNRYMHVSGIFAKEPKANIESEKVNIEPEKANIEPKKANIGPEKANIGPEKVNIEPKKANIGPEKVNIEPEKANIEPEKANIEPEKVNIDAEEESRREIEVNIEREEMTRARLLRYAFMLEQFSVKTNIYVEKMYEVFGTDTVFGRSDVQTVIGLKPTRASGLLNMLFDLRIIEPVKGHGKGKYKFSQDISLPE